MEPFERLQEIKRGIQAGDFPSDVDIEVFNVHEKLLPRVRHDDDEIVLVEGTIWLIRYNDGSGNLGGHSLAWCCSASPELVEEIRSLGQTIRGNVT